ncbi:MAG: replication-associated recombination protein A [Oscillospiraceae bacterium]|jgi:putative ATPase|nr:replication-associated recombination protein A [Oscillospiraceae bacterium]
MPYRPLADELRPESLDDLVGQGHILGEGGLLRRAAESGSVPNMIFYGPSGSGKTTAANIIASASGRVLRKLNATTAVIADIKAVIAELGTFLAPNGILLYLDEIQYFNKKQQQSLLEFIENGKITLIASTTENPYFYVYNAVLSRCAVFEFKPLSAADAEKTIYRAVRYLEKRDGAEIEIPEEAVRHIASSCGGDARRAINAVELLFSAAKREGGKISVSAEDARAASQKGAMRYDRDGDEHYDILSALHKSIRGSDADAALHYLARLLEAGDIISPCRRILCAACEDIGLAYPAAIPIVKACVDAAAQLGMPEARLPLADAVILLCTAPKSNSGVLAIDAALADVRAGKTGTVPRELQNVHADGAGFEREQGYKYPHDYPNNWTAQQYLPDAIKDAKYYEFGENKSERAAKKYWEGVKAIFPEDNTNDKASREVNIRNAQIR